MPHEAVQPILITELRSDVELVELWRAERLEAAGYPADLTEKLAPRLDIDLHVACELVERGCSPSIAAVILL